MQSIAVLTKKRAFNREEHANGHCQESVKYPLRNSLSQKRLVFGVGVGVTLFEELLSGPLNRLNAILSLLQPLDRYRTPSAIVSAIGRPYLALSRIHTQVGVLPRSKLLSALNRASIVAL